MKFQLNSLLCAVLATATLWSTTSAAPIEERSSSPAGLNNWNCKPSAAHPRPVVLVHGTTLTASSWDDMSPYIIREGYCVFSLTYGWWKNVPVFAGIAPIPDNAQEVGNFILKVLNATGASQVDVVGHSQGGILGRYWQKYQGGQGKIYRQIGLSPINQGTTLDGVVTLGKILGLFDFAQSVVDQVAPALFQMTIGSPFMTQLNSGSDSDASIHSNLATKYDEVVTPYTNCYETASGVTNTLLQDLCSLSVPEHLLIQSNKVATRWVLNQLDPDNARTANCLSNIFL